MHPTPLNSGTRSVQIQGDATGTVIITGDGNRVTLTRHPQDGPFFHLVDEAFRARQRARQPADFYNGTRPNWANIAAEHDAPRTLLDEILAFVGQPPGQRFGVILGPAGEGKTTLLMRAAWELSRQGYAVLWRHYGHVEGNYALPLEAGKPLVLCFDDLPQEKERPALLRDLAESGLPFVVLGSARQMDWASLEWAGQVTRLAAAQEFLLARLQEGEARALLGKLEMAGALGALQAMRPQERLRYLLKEASAHQLLPALLTIRYGRAFDSILEDVLRRVQGLADGLPLRGFGYIALVHRFGLPLSRRLCAALLGIAESEIPPRLLRPLEGELLSLTLGEERRLFTRHPLIAERSLRLAAGRFLPEESDLYAALFDALGALLRQHPGAEERKLLAPIALAFKRQGDTARARELFQQAAQADSSDAPTLQAWALLEKEQGNVEEARRLFAQAAQADPKYALVYQAWALLEKEQGNVEEARRLFGLAAQADPKDAPTLQAWALLEKEQGNVEEARRLFGLAAQADPKHAPVYQAWALLEAQQGNARQAREILERGLRQVQEKRGRALLHSALGGLLARQQDYAQAERHFQEALRLHPKDPLTHYHYAVDCLAPQRLLDQACQHLRRAQELRPRKARDRRKIEQALRKYCR